MGIKIKKSKENLKTFQASSRRYFILDFFIILKFCLILVILGILIAVLRADFFKVTFIDCQKGEFACSEQDIAFFNELLGKNIFLVSENELTKNIELKDLSLEKVWIGKKLPNRLLIKLQPRKPVAILVTQKGNFLVDETGFVFSSTIPQNQNLPTILVQTPQSVTLGITVEENIKKSLELTKMLQSFFLPFEKLAVEKDDLIVYSSDFVATFSNSKDFSTQISSLQLIFQSSKIKRQNDSPLRQDKKITKIDLRFDKPLVIFDE